MKIFAHKDGTVQAVYDDKHRPLFMAIGTVWLRRASRVEPDPRGNGDPRFSADLSLSGGPSRDDFETHREAVAWEIDWLSRRLLEGPIYREAAS